MRILFPLIALAAAGVPLLQAQNPLWIDLSGEWRISTSDKPEYAGAEFDDSGWAVAKTPFNTRRPLNYWWLRRKIELSGATAPSEPLVLTVGALNEVYEVFVNGKRAGAAGGPALSQSFVARPRSFALPAGVARRPRLTIAIRLWTPRNVNWSHARSINAVFPDSGPWLLTEVRNAPHDEAAAALGRRKRSAIPNLVLGAVAGLLAVLLISSWNLQRERTDLLLLGGFLLSEGYRWCSAYSILAADLPHLADMMGGLTLSLSSLLLSYLAQKEAGRHGRWLPLPAWLAFADHVFQNLTITISNGALLPSYMPLRVLAGISQFSITVVSARSAIQAWRKGNHGSALSAASIASLALLESLGSTLLVAPPRSMAFGMRWELHNFLVIGVAFGLTLHLVRNLGVARQRLTQELHAARIVQQLLLGTGSNLSPVYSIDAEYYPAQEVGGDFYQVLPLKGGSLLLAAGDVSGKGLRAAMVVSMIVGIVRSHRELEPAVLLDKLNRTLNGTLEGGFVTCLVARLDPDGSVMVANAGHLSPYLRSAEMEMESGLPLGITPEAQYPGTTSRLASGEALTFVTDGVVEAANKLGELFGFDRTSKISGQSAATIAEAARAWGQNDDITVTTVRRVAAAVAHA